MTPVVWAAATRAKVGHRPDENEDAVAAAPTALRFALADGASEGWNSRSWADHLARAFVRRPPSPANYPDWLAEARAGWAPPEPAGQVAWYAEAKRTQGAHATLVGVSLTPRPADRAWVWRAVGVGDSCLFQVRGGDLLVSFPLSAPHEFDHTPRLVSSAASGPAVEPEWLAGRAEPGDLLVLASDAVAAWLLTADRSGAGVWRRVAEALGAGEPSARAAGLSSMAADAQACRNDDATLLAVLTPPPPEPAG
jgi:hypothetical protein